MCSDEFKKCTKKGGDNVYVNSDACDSNIFLSGGISLRLKRSFQFINRKLKITCVGGQECYISEDDSESHCMKKIDSEFPTLLYPGYKCTYGDDAAKCTFGPK